MNTRFPLAAAAAFAPLLVLAACGGADEPAAEPTDALAASDPAADPALPTDSQAFVDTASASDLFEIEAGKLAQANGTSQAVKDFGAMMERDHTKSSADLKAAAGRVDGVTVAPALTPKHEADLDALMTAGTNFDSVYKTQQLAAHNQALALLQNMSTNGPAGPLKDFATKTAPVVETHLGHAEMLP